MKSLSGTTPTLRAIAVTLFAFSVSLLTGCAGNFHPVVNTTPSSIGASPSAPRTPGNTDSTLGVAYNPSTDLLYVLKKGNVASGYAGTVSVINRATNVITATIPVGAWPYGVAVNQLTNTIYVTNYAGPSLSIINGATNVVTATIPNTGVGDTPYGVAVNPLTNKVYVTDIVGDLTYGMYVLNGTTGAVLSAIRTDGDVFSVAVNTLTNTIYATTQSAVLAINGDTDTVQATVKGTINLSFGASGIVVDEAANVVYVGSTTGSSNGGVTLINGATNAIASTVALGSVPTNLALDPVKHVVYATMSNPSVVGVIDTTKNVANATISLVAAPVAVVVNPTTSLVYVTEASELAVINPTGSTTTDVLIK